MKDLQLKSHRFRAERENDWRRLESLLAKAEGGRAGALTDAELIEIPVLYRAACSSLSVARATSLDASLVAYLESLVTRGYFFVYGPRTRLLDRITRFFRYDWPAAVKDLWRETAVSAAIFIVATVAAFVLVQQDNDWYDTIVGPMAQGRDFTASTAYLKKILYDDDGGHFLGGFATFLFTHNAQVSIFCFALGFAFGAPTAMFIAQQGLVLGAMLSLYAARGLGFQMGGWLMIHGATELFACVLSGAAGFRVGWAVAFPGDKSRLDAASEAGKRAGVVMIGVVLMLVIAGVLEGVGRQTIRVDWIRYAIAGSTLSLWLAYFYLPRPRAPA
ncbi:MAG TPA: stage II sporulation protein M [Caulobacteraceae bacterium]|nr:stage II sporulation protein M [Caulobacteraceae bacterium]